MAGIAQDGPEADTDAHHISQAVPVDGNRANLQDRIDVENQVRKGKDNLVHGSAFLVGSHGSERSIRRAAPNLPGHSTPMPRKSISRAMRTSNGMKILRMVLLESRASVFAPTVAPSSTPSATGAATNGWISPRWK